MVERKMVTTTICVTSQRKFKARCAENGEKMNEVLSSLMNMYAYGEIPQNLLEKYGTKNMSLMQKPISNNDRRLETLSAL